MESKRTTYADRFDRHVMRHATDALQPWFDFVSVAFQDLRNDHSFGRRVVIDVGAGRAIEPDEMTFFRQFDRVVMLEPDDERRAALAVVADPGTEILADPIQELNPASVPGADFVLCKWVIQHLPTDAVATAIETLKALCAPGGTLGIFSASSAGDPYYLLSAPQHVIAELPERLRPGKFGRISRAQFEELISNDSGLEYITTHHLDRQSLLAQFEGWEIATTVSDFGAMYVQARRPVAQR